MKTSKVNVWTGKGPKDLEVDWEVSGPEGDVTVLAVRPEVEDRWWRDSVLRSATHALRQQVLDDIPHEVVAREGLTTRVCLNVWTRRVRFKRPEDARRWLALERAQGRGQGFWSTVSDDGLEVSVTWECDSSD